jgi:hypothetical protein
MALFTDGPACTIEDLTGEDSGLLATAETVGINVTTKLWLAMSEVQSEVENWLLRPQPAIGPPWTHPQAIGNVVVTRELARWVKMQTLTMVYRDAYFGQLIDRYQGKWDEYAKLTRYARDQFVANGIGLAANPMPKAAIPVLGTISLPSQQAGGTFYACVTWVNQAGQEGAASDAGSITVPDDNLMTVMASGDPANAVGFNVYVGTAPATTNLQSQVPLPAGATFTYLPGAVTSNQIAGTGQKPDYVKPLPRTILRG